MPFVPGYTWDIFVSYGHGATCSGFLGEEVDRVSLWSKQFVSDLKSEILSRLGSRDPELIKIWMDPLLPGHHLITDSLRSDVERSALLLVIMSPYFLESPWCQKELHWFSAKSSNSLNHRSSIFVVRAFSTDEANWPDLLRDSVGVVAKGYNFLPPTMEPDVVANPFGWPRPTERDQEYWKALGRLAIDIARQLKALAAASSGQSSNGGATARSAEDPAAAPARAGAGRTVYLGLMPETVAEGSELRDALVAAGIAVLPPDANEVVDEVSLRAAFGEYLDSSDALVLIADAYCGRWPKGQDGGFVGFQIKEARLRNLPCYLWLQVGDPAAVKRPEDRAFFERLASQAADEKLTVRHADVASFVRYITDSLGTAVIPEPGVETLAVVCSNLPSEEHVGRSCQETVLDALSEARRSARTFTFADVNGHQISLVELQTWIHDADTVLLLCFDHQWKWAWELVKQLSKIPDLRAGVKARLIVAGPHCQAGDSLEARPFGFKTINGVGLDAARLRDRVKSEILATCLKDDSVRDTGACWVG